MSISESVGVVSGFSCRPDVQTFVRTLVTGGFVLEDANRNPGYMLFHAYRWDEFGAVRRYCFALADNGLSEAQVAAAKIAAEYHQAQLVLIGESDSELPRVEWERFINLFGGPVFTTIRLEPDFTDQLIELGHNKLPDGLQGNADDLFERYVQVALEFLLGGRVVRWGQTRRFEERPDGIALPSLRFSALYDAKAYADGYQVTINAIRQFKTYVEDFARRYENYLPRLNAFLVISGTFPHRERTLERRSRDLLSQCGVPLSFLTAYSLAEILGIVSELPQARRSINWCRIFTEPIARPGHVRSELEAIRRDGIIGRP